jgi:hypothetical protein
LHFATTIGFEKYLQEAEYRRLHPEFLPSPIIVKAFDMGHSSAYGSLLWIEFIQYLSHNLKDSDYLSFSNIILQQITDLHPYFIRPYELSLILSPFWDIENINIEQKIENEKHSEEAIKLWKKWMELLCNQSILNEIRARNITDDLLNDPNTKNPCHTWLLPYYIGFVISQMGNNKIEASDYYKIASAQEDAPPASKILWILALSGEGDYMASALNFWLLWSNWYDTEPFICKNMSKQLIQDISQKRELNSTWIEELEKNEKKLQNTINHKDPLTQTKDNCVSMMEKGIKYIYLAYIASKTNNTPFTTGNELIKAKVISKIPVISSQKGYSVRLKDGIWQYTTIIQ